MGADIISAKLAPSLLPRWATKHSLFPAIIHDPNHVKHVSSRQPRQSPDPRAAAPPTPHPHVAVPQPQHRHATVSTAFQTAQAIPATIHTALDILPVIGLQKGPGPRAVSFVSANAPHAESNKLAFITPFPIRQSDGCLSRAVGKAPAGPGLSALSDPAHVCLRLMEA